MLTQDSTIDHINFLTQSPVRVHLLELLYDESELSKSELTERFNVSRVTIKRNLEALEEHDWIENTHPTYRITPLGELVIAEMSSLTESVRVAQKLRPVFKWIPPDSFDLDPQLLVDATIIEADGTNPTDWVRYHTDRIESASYIRAILPGTGINAWEAAVDSSADSEFEAIVIVGPQVAETLQTDPAYTDKITVLFNRDALELYVYDGTIPYHLTQLDQYIQFVVTDDEGIPRALVETESAPVRQWAENEFQSYRAQSVPFARWEQNTP